MFCGEDYGTVDVRNTWTAEAKLRFVLQCVSMTGLKELGPLVTQTRSLSTAVYHMVAQHNVCILFLQYFNAMPTPLSVQCSGVSVGSRAETILSALCQMCPLNAPPCWCVGHSPVWSGRCQTAGTAESGHA